MGHRASGQKSSTRACSLGKGVEMKESGIVYLLPLMVYLPLWEIQCDSRPAAEPNVALALAKAGVVPGYPPRDPHTHTQSVMNPP